MAAGRDRLALACEIGDAISQAPAREDALTTVAERIALALDVWECDLFEYYPESETVVGAAFWCREPRADDAAWVGTRVAIEERRSYRSVLHDRTCVVVQQDDSDIDPVDQESMRRWGELSALSVPLVVVDDVIGCLMLIEKRAARRFDDGDIELASLLADQASIAVAHARRFREQEERNRHLSSLLESSRALVSTVSLEQALDRLCRTATGALGAGECTVYEYDPRQSALVIRACHDAVGIRLAKDAVGSAYPLDDDGPSAETLGCEEVTQGAFSEALLPAAVCTAAAEWSGRPCLRVPLLVDRDLMGVLTVVDADSGRRFDADEIDLARGLGEQAATAIRHARLYRRRERQNRRQLAILETSRVLASSLDAGAVLAEMRREVAALFAASGDDVGVYVRHEDGFYPLDAQPGAARAGQNDDAPKALELDELASRAITDLSPAREDEADACRLAVPLVLGDVAEGLLDVRVAGSHRFSEDELGLLQILANQAAAALANAALYRRLERQAITDGLTGLYNHRYFYERLTQEHARARRYDLPLSLLMIDIDDFKHFNDRFGHQVGDLVLTEVGSVLLTQIRRHIDFAARYGGEEFVVLLPNTSRGGAQVVGTRLARELAALAGDVPPPNELSALDVGERIRGAVETARVTGAVWADARITVSVGVAGMDGATGGPDGLVRNADKALYLAKRLGRNRVEVFDD